MTIKQIETGIIRIPLKTAFKTALREVTYIEDVVVRISVENGLVGYGEAPPTVAITGEDSASIVQTIAYIKPLLINQNIEDIHKVVEIIQNCCPKHTSAKAAVEMAMLDLAAQMKEVPLYKYLGAKEAKSLQTDITISVDSIDKMVFDSVQAVANGFSILKIKVGVDNRLDLQRLQAISEAVGSKIALRVDANQAWNLKESLHNLEAMKRMGLPIEFVEQPVPALALDELALVTQADLFPIVADEALFSLEDAKKILDTNAADILNIKLMKTGGITQAQAICQLAKKYEKKCMMGSMLETIISVSAAAHLGIACDNIIYFDLDGPMLGAYIPSVGGASYQGDMLSVSSQSGLGIKNVF